MATTDKDRDDDTLPPPPPPPPPRFESVASRFSAFSHDERAQLGNALSTWIACGPVGGSTNDEITEKLIAELAEINGAP